MKNKITVSEYIKKNEDFLLKHWSKKLNGMPYSEISSKDRKWRWQCAKCGDTSVYNTVSAAKRRECLCEVCYELEQKRKQEQRLVHRELNISKNRSFGQTATLDDLKTQKIETREEMHALIGAIVIFAKCHLQNVKWISAVNIEDVSSGRDLEFKITLYK